MTSQRKFHRRSIRLKEYDYSTCGDYFITLVTHNRLPLFGFIKNETMILSANGRIAEKTWLSLKQHFPYIELGPHIIMPNHIHFIISIIEEDYDCTSKACLAPSDTEINLSTGKACLAPTRNPNFSPSDIEIDLHSSKSCLAPTIENHSYQSFGKPPARSIPSIIGSFKSAVTNQIHKNTESDFSIWQRNYFEHIINSDEEYDRIAGYIDFNPLNWHKDTFFNLS